MSTKATVKRPGDFEPTGIVDGKHTFFECSSCGAPLADIWVNYPDDIEWNFIAECCHCGGKSYEKKIKGAFSIGSTEKSEKYTVVESFDLESDPIVIKTKQVNLYVS